uniref:Zinc finger protein 395 n=1 Tax=Apteryx owenii TaxID=8824 RepID=A0A8B9QEX6_APTOW
MQRKEESPVKSVNAKKRGKPDAAALFTGLLEEPRGKPPPSRVRGRESYSGGKIRLKTGADAWAMMKGAVVSPPENFPPVVKSRAPRPSPRQADCRSRLGGSQARRSGLESARGGFRSSGPGAAGGRLRVGNLPMAEALLRREVPLGIRRRVGGRHPAVFRPRGSERCPGLQERQGGGAPPLASLLLGAGGLHSAWEVTQSWRAWSGSHPLRATPGQGRPLSRQRGRRDRKEEPLVRDRQNRCSLLPSDPLITVSEMASVLSRRLGKRSLLGTRVSAPGSLADGVLVSAQLPGLPADLSRVPSHAAPWEDGPGKERAEESSRAPRFPSPNRPQLHAGQQVVVTYTGQERAGLAEQHHPPSDKVKVLLPERGPRGARRVEDARPAELRRSPLPASGTEPLRRSVSSSIDVPRRKADAAVEMDEMVAAMVLTSLSCSPVVQSPPAGDSAVPPSRAACDPWKESGDVSDSGSSTTSGHWSGGSDICTPPRADGSPKHSSEALGSPPADDGFDTDSDPFLLDEPAPRKRKNSVKVMYKCLWPGCGKVLRSIVGIKRHVKTQHLGDGADSDQRKREEDFYYTEVQVKEEPAPESAASPTSAAAPVGIQPAPAKPEAPPAEAPAREPAPAGSALSQSAPSSFWHIQADHAYQALPSIQIPVSPHIFTSISWATATSTLPSLSPVSPVWFPLRSFPCLQVEAGWLGWMLLREPHLYSWPALNVRSRLGLCLGVVQVSVQLPCSAQGLLRREATWSHLTFDGVFLLQVRSRSLSFSEPQPATPMLKSHLIVASPPRVSLGTR